MRLEFNQVEFHAFKNLRTLLLDRCRPSYNNELLRHLLQNSPNLEKLTVHCCKVFLCIVLQFTVTLAELCLLINSYETFCLAVLKRFPGVEEIIPA